MGKHVRYTWEWKKDEQKVKESKNCYDVKYGWTNLKDEYNFYVS